MIASDFGTLLEATALSVILEICSSYDFMKLRCPSPSLDRRSLCTLRQMCILKFQELEIFMIATIK